ncbi:MAG TPA: alpha/beta hydrolase [Gemmatirosa sp.]
MLPRFFGDTGRQLFGVYHPASAAPGVSAQVRRTGVVLCYPGPQEYRQAHWAYRRLAGLLADGGVHVLRFDYVGTGDSAGASSDGSLAQWADDVRAAARELQDVAGVRRTALVGLRLGAVIAARACAAGLAVSDLVLWDPVVRGTEYLAGLDAEQGSGLEDRRYPEDDRRASDELLGFEMTAAMRAEIGAVDLTVEACGAPGRVLVIAADDGPEYGAFGAALTARATRCEVRHVADATLARGGHWASDTLMARNIPGVIRDFIARPARAVAAGAVHAHA